MLGPRQPKRSSGLAKWGWHLLVTAAVLSAALWFSKLGQDSGARQWLVRAQRRVSEWWFSLGTRQENYPSGRYASKPSMGSQDQ